MRRARVLVGVAVANLIGCSLIVETSDLVEPASNADAAPAPAEAGMALDAGDDDGGADGGDAGAPRPACGPGEYCDDFERDDPKGAWDDVFTTGGAALTIDPAAPEGGRSLRLVCPATEATCEGTVIEDAAAATHVRWSFRLRTAALPTRNVHLGAVVWPSAKAAAFFILRPTGLFLAEQKQGAAPTFFEEVPVPTFTADRWHTLEVELTAPRRLRGSIDGATFIDVEAPLTLPSSGLELRLGATFSTPGDGFTLWFDDARFLAE